MRVGELLEALPSERLADVETFLSRPQGADASLALRCLVAIGAWFAAIFLLMFLALANLIRFSDHGPDLVIGLLLICGATLAARRTQGLFLQQLALACSVAGHILVLFHVTRTSLAGTAITACILAAILYRLYPGGIHPFLSVGSALLVVLAWMAESFKAPGLTFFLVVQIAALARIPSRTRPLALALAISAPVTVLAIQSFETLWPATVILTVTLLAQVRWTVPEMDPRVRTMLYAAALGLGMLSTPGVLGALSLLVFAHDRDDRGLAAIALAFLAWFIVYFYYSLDVGLDAKAYILMASGVLLLAVRRGMR